MVSAKDLGFCIKYVYRLGVAIFSIHFSFIYNYVGDLDPLDLFVALTE